MMRTEELQGLRDGQVQDIVNVQPLESHIEDVVLESVSMTGFALQHEVGHELHLYRDDASALAFVATATVGIEREILWRKAHLFC